MTPSKDKARLLVYVEPAILDWLDREVAAQKAEARRAGNPMPSRTTVVENVLRKHMERKNRR